MPNKKLAYDYFEVECPWCGDVNNLYVKKGCLNGPDNSLNAQCHECGEYYEVAIEWQYRIWATKHEDADA